ncbi:MAG: hypothetical protein KAY24_19155 [Candidatus Eisenbacteria sp.]|nr:hypothetical protein [Candidatus Eisenbacteria bacterium]
MSGALGEVDVRFRGMMQRLTPSERLAMACRMFSTGRALVVAGLRSRNRDLTGLHLRRALLKRLYGRDLDAEQLDRIEIALGQPNKRIETDGGASD